MPTRFLSRTRGLRRAPRLLADLVGVGAALAAVPADAQVLDLDAKLSGLLTKLGTTTVAAPLTERVGVLGEVTSDLVGPGGVLTDIEAEIGRQGDLLDLQAGDILSLRTDLTDLRTIVTTGTNLTDLRSTVSTLTTDLRTATTVIAEHGRDIASLKTTTAVLGRDVASLRDDLGRHETRLDDHGERLDAQAGDIADLHLRTTGHGDRLDDHEAAMTEQGDRLADHDDQLAAHDDQLSEHETRMTGQDGRLDGHEERLSGHDERLAAYGRQVVGYERQVANYGQAITQQGARLAEHERRLGGHDRTLAEHGAAISALGGRLDIANQGVAMALAMKAPAVGEGQSFALSGGWGTFEGENAFAVSGAVRATDNIQIDGGMALGSGNASLGGRAGATISW